MGRRKMLSHLEDMLEAAIRGEFQESDYDETRLSRLETKWKQFLAASQLSRQNLQWEKENVKQLISDISHQTKTPITNMKLYVSLLQESIEQSALEDVQQSQNLQLLSEVRQQTEKLEFLINALTKLSRLESNTVEVHPEIQKISPLLEEAIRNIQPKADKKEIQIRVPSAEDITACFDYKWTREALENILDNAVKYSFEKSEIVIDLREYEMYMVISVKDKGIGISPENHTKIFQRFYRAPEVQQKDGVGLGLYLAREILKKENGYIRVKSRPGEGSEFSLYLWRG